MGSKYLFKLEYDNEKFSSFFVNLYEKKDYNFADITNDIRNYVRSLQYVMPSTIRMEFKDDDGDYMNLLYEDGEMFKQMFETSNPVKDRIYLKVSQLHSPVLNPLPKSKHAALKVREGNDDNRKMEPLSPFFDKSLRRRPMLTAARSKLSPRFLDGIEDEDGDEEEYYNRIDSTQNIPATITSLSPLERYMKSEASKV